MLRRMSLRRIPQAALCALLLSTAHAAPPVKATHAGEATQAHASLREALRAPPSKQARRKARAAMGRLDRLVDIYFHAPNLSKPEARAAVLSLRAALQPALHGPDAVLHFEDDALRYRPEVRARLESGK